MKVALIHDWLVGMRGGEKCLEVFCELFPQADIYTIVHVRGSSSPLIERHTIKTSFIQKLPFSEKTYRYYLPLMPKAIEQFDLTPYDVIISSSHCVAKGVNKRKDALHICYCHTPMRYIWEMFDDYFGNKKSSLVVRAAMAMVAPYLRRWDVRSAERVDHFIANSFNVQKRIKQHYDRDAEVIHPPVTLEAFHISGQPGDYYLVVSALTPYKRIDLAVEAFNVLGLPLKVFGSGEEQKRLQRMAKKNIEFLGWQNTAHLRDYYANCQALIFPGIEDFGIVPLEAMASGRPVIAYGQGGALETIVPINQTEHGDGATGIFFYEPTVASLVEAVHCFKEKQHLFNPQVLRKHAETFNRPLFKARMQAFIERKVKEWER